jgi:hypothetical protein
MACLPVIGFGEQFRGDKSSDHRFRRFPQNWSELPILCNPRLSQLLVPHLIEEACATILRMKSARMCVGLNRYVVESPETLPAGQGDRDSRLRLRWRWGWHASRNLKAPFVGPYAPPAVSFFIEAKRWEGL